MKLNVKLQSKIDWINNFKEKKSIEDKFNNLVENIGNVLIYDKINVYSEIHYNMTYIGIYEFYVPFFSIFYSYENEDHTIIDFITIPINEEFDVKDIVKKIKRNIISKNLNNEGDY